MDTDRYFWLAQQELTNCALRDCDIELVKKSLLLIADPSTKKEILPTLISYINACNDAFTASEHIRHLLLLSLGITLILSIVSIALMPIGVTAITLISLLTVLLFTVNLATTCIQANNQQQHQDRDRLATLCKKAKSSYQKVQANTCVNDRIWSTDKMTKHQAILTCGLFKPALADIQEVDEQQTIASRSSPHCSANLQ